jgi:recombination protein RecT
MGPQFKMALPPHIPVERFVRVVQTAVANAPDLLECSRQSLYGAAMRSAQDGLIPDGHEAAIVKFGQQAQYMPMVKGILKKVRNSGELKTIAAHVVYERDEYEYFVDEEGEHFRHVKARGDRGRPILTYAYAHTKDGGFYFEELDEDDISAIRKVSRSSGGPWAGPFADEMRRKSAIRRLSKRLPMSTDLEETLRADRDLFEPEEETVTAAPAEPPPSSTAEEQATGRKRPGALDKVVGAAKRRDTSQAQDAEARAPASQDNAASPPAGHPASVTPPDEEPPI